MDEPRTHGRTATVVGWRLIVGAVLGMSLVLAAGFWLGGRLVTPENATIRSIPPTIDLTSEVEARRLELTVVLRAIVTPVTVIVVDDPGQLPNVVTKSSPPVGSKVAEGAILLELGGRPVVMLFGQFPAWRAFAREMSPGPDIAQLQQALARLGFYQGDVDGRYGSSTAAAIAAFGENSGYDLTNGLEIGQVQFVPEVGLEVIGAVAVGDTLEPGALGLELASSEIRLDARMTTDQIRKLRPDMQVRLRGQDGELLVETSIVDVDTLAVTADTDPNVGLHISDSDVPADLEVNGSILTEVVLDSTEGTVLVVPASALVETSPGEYAVIVVSPEGGETTLPVTVELITADGVGVTSSDPQLVAGVDVRANP